MVWSTFYLSNNMSTSFRTNNSATILYFPLRLIQLLHILLLKIFPPSSTLKRTDNIYVETLGLVGLFLFLFNINLVWDLHRNGETMLIIAFFLAIRHWWGVLVRQPLFWLMIAFAVALVISTMIGMENLPESRHKSEAQKMARLCLFVPLAWWIGSNIVSIKNAFLIVCTGFITASLPWLLDWNTLSALLEGQRAGGDITGLGAVRFGAWYGFFLLGFGILGRELLPDRLMQGRMAILGFFCFFLIVFVLLLGLYVSHTRTAWLTLMLTVPFGLIICYLHTFNKNILTLRNSVFPLLFFLLVLLFAVAQFDNIKNRFLQESSAYNKILSGQWEDIEMSSLGQRIHKYRWALQTESFVTIFGWGPRAIQAINRNEELKNELEWNIPSGHLHSDMLSTIFRTGLFGSSIFFMIYFFLFRGIYKGYRRQIISPVFYAYFSMIFIYAIIIGLLTTTFRMHAFIPVWMGLIYAVTIHLPHKQEIAQKINQH